MANKMLGQGKFCFEEAGTSKEPNPLREEFLLPFSVRLATLKLVYFLS